MAIDHSRPTKRRKVNKQPVVQASAEEDEELYFPTLLGGAESKECVKLRQNLYEGTWGSVDVRIQVTHAIVLAIIRCLIFVGNT